MRRTFCWTRLAPVACAIILGASDAGAYRMIQNTSVGRTSFGTRVTCDDPVGFAHWTTASISWRLNPANQGGKPGTTSALLNALTAWTSVSPASYTLSFAGTTSGGFSTDGVNTVSWGSDGGCTGGCLALTALVLGPGQVITEADILFNDAATWNTDGSDYDVEAIAAHELGHTLGIHHTDLTKRRNRPSMYASYFGIEGRSLESDDWSALNCSFNRYTPLGASLAVAQPAAKATRNASVTLTSRTRPGGAILRFTLEADERVRLELFDVAGRKLATLVDGVAGAGMHELAWDGSTNSAHHAGVYFARMITPIGTASTTVLLTE